MNKIWGFGSRSGTTTPPGIARSNKAPVRTPKPLASTQWYAISLVPGTRCCTAVKVASRQRLLSALAPRFPLPGCDLTVCECRYQHHTDRRGGARRRTDRDSLPRQYEGQERRASRHDRRLTDK